MSLTCANKPMLQRSKPLALALAMGVSLLLTAPAFAAKGEPKSSKPSEIELPAATDAVLVSDYEFNTFVFSEPAKRVLFPSGSPVSGEPITLAGGTQILLQFSRGNDRPVQMVVELASGKVEKLRVLPKAIPGVTYPVNGARVRTSSPNPVKVNAAVQGDASAGNAPSSADIDLLKKVISSGEAPDGFDPVSLPLPTKFDKFTVVPLAGWGDGTKRVLVFSLVAAVGQTAVVTPNQFYRDGITAVMLDGDTVDNHNSPQLFVVEALSDE